MSTIAITGAIVGIVGAVAGGTTAAVQGSKNNKAGRLEKAKARRLRQQMERFEQQRQPVINQADNIRALKGQVFNEAANLGVAMQSYDMQVAETDKALANTLDTIAAMGEGAGNATALAQMAASSKAEVSASIEVQEVENQKLRAAGEAKRQQTIRDLETTALAEEVSAWDRQEVRDVTKLNRLSGLEERAMQAGVAYEQMAQQQTAQAIGDFADAGTQAFKLGTAGNEDWNMADAFKNYGTFKEK